MNAHELHDALHFALQTGTVEVLGERLGAAFARGMHVEDLSRADQLLEERNAAILERNDARLALAELEKQNTAQAENLAYYRKLRDEAVAGQAPLRAVVTALLADPPENPWKCFGCERFLFDSRTGLLAGLVAPRCSKCRPLREAVAVFLFPNPCPTCGISGRVGDAPCTTCGGRGRVR